MYSWKTVIISGIQNKVICFVCSEIGQFVPESCESSKVIVFTLSSLLNNADSSLLGLGAILVGVRTGFLDRITLLPPEL